MEHNVMMEMGEDERLLLQLDTNIDYAFYKLAEGFNHSKIYESVDGQELIDKLTDKLAEASELVQKLQYIVSKED